MRLVRLLPTTTVASREIYILAGESDMSGRGDLGSLPSFGNASKIVNYANSGAWVAGAEPIDDDTDQVDVVSADSIATASPGMAFADALSSLRGGRQIGLVPCAKGGSWMTDWARNLSRSTLYGSMIARAQEAAAAGVIKGLIFMQGKNGSADLAEANAWGDNFDQFVSDVRSDLGIADLAVIVTVVNTTPGGTYISTIQDAQLAMTGTGIAVVDARDLPDQGDSARHLTTAGLVTLGERYADAMDDLLA